MSRIVDSFDPSVTPAGPISTGTHSDYGLSVLNESNIGITITLSSSGSQLTVPAYYLLSVHICTIGDSFDWKAAYTVPTLGAAPISLAVFTIFQPSELDTMPPSGPLSRLTNVGNTIPVGGNVTQVFNDGNVAPTVVVEGTPSGAPGSELKWNNDGSGLFGGGLIAVNSSGIFTAIPNQSIPSTALQNGALPVGVIAQSVANDGKAHGTRVLEATPTGTATSGFVFFNDGNGNIASGAIAWNAAGVFTAMPANAIPAAAVASPLPVTTFIGSSTTEQIGFNVGGSGDVGIVSATRDLWLFGVGGAGENDIGFNLFWDGANFRYLTNNVANRLKFDGSGILEFFNYPSGTAGNIASAGVSQGNVIQGKTAGGGSATNAMWSGTSDPGGSASEGDLWFNV